MVAVFPSPCYDFHLVMSFIYVPRLLRLLRRNAYVTCWLYTTSTQTFLHLTSKGISHSPLKDTSLGFSILSTSFSYRCIVLPLNLLGLAYTSVSTLHATPPDVTSFTNNRFFNSSTLFTSLYSAFPHTHALHHKVNLSHSLFPY